MSKVSVIEDHLEVDCDCGIHHVIRESEDGEPVLESIYRKENGKVGGEPEETPPGAPVEKEGTEGRVEEPAKADTVKILGLTFSRARATA